MAPANILNGLEPGATLPNRVRDLRQRRVGGLGHAVQNTRSANVAGISKQWPARCLNRRSRGLPNGGEKCYRLSTMQGLLNIPQFLNWIEQHNGTPASACAIRSPTSRAQNCPICNLKRIAQRYWDGRGVDSHVVSFDAAVWGIRRRANMRHDLSRNQQEDAAEFLEWLVSRAMLHTLRPVGIPTWQQQYEGLFATRIVQRYTCKVCSTTRPSAAGADDEFPLVVFPTPDTNLQAVVANKFTDQSIKVNCDNCARTTDQASAERIVSAPEILVVKIRRDNAGSTGVVFKNFDQIKVNKTLNLTDFQENKDLTLIYELSGVVSHIGANITEGHYIAHTTGPVIRGRTPVYEISDWRVRNSTHKMLSQDPKIYRGDNAESYFAFYIKSGSSHPTAGRVYAGMESTARPFGQGQTKRVRGARQAAANQRANR